MVVLLSPQSEIVSSSRLVKTENTTSITLQIRGNKNLVELAAIN